MFSRFVSGLGKKSAARSGCATKIASASALSATGTSILACAVLPNDSADSEHGGWQAFFAAMGALAIAMLLAIYSRAAAENGTVWLAGLSAMAALAIAAWVTYRFVPVLARRSPLGLLAIRMDYRITREGWLYMGGVLVLALAALNTGNNMLFIILASLLAGLLLSGVLSHTILSGVELRLDVPEHVFVGQPVRALAELSNRKSRMPSFSLRLCSASAKRKAKLQNAKQANAGESREVLSHPVYFPYIAAGERVQQSVELEFPRRGVYRQEFLDLRTRFPFGFVEKSRRLKPSLETIVYPAIQPTDGDYQKLSLVSGELESFLRGRGQDLYAIRAYQGSDSARHVDWKASAKRNTLQVREFTREDERRVLLVLDPFLSAKASRDDAEKSFEKGVSLCASLAWHFYESEAVLGFRTAGFETPLAPAGEVIYDILRNLALVEAQGPEQGDSFLSELSGSSQLFKVVLTAQPRGSIPATVWNSSYVIFLE
jgi:uncharacterized protein (DUF58 family)